MLEELMSKLQTMAKDTIMPQKVLENQYSTTFFLPQNGEMVDIPKPAAPLHRKFADFTDYLEYLTSRSDIQSDKGIRLDAEGAVKVASDGPCCFIDDETLHAIYYIEAPHATNTLKATLAMSFTEAYEWLRENDGKVFKQAAFVGVLKTTLYDSLGSVADSLIKLLSNLSFTANNNIKANVGQGYSSFDKQVLNEVKGVEAIPERLTLNIRKYKEFNNTQALEVALIAHSESGGFSTQLIGDTHDAFNRQQYLAMKAHVSNIIPKTYRGQAQ